MLHIRKDKKTAEGSIYNPRAKNINQKDHGGRKGVREAPKVIGSKTRSFVLA